MAINKNFVIKNGVQVDTDLIVGDSNTKKVGIGTTVPEYTLHVGATNAAGRGGIGATDLNVTGVGTVQNLNVLGLSTFAGNASVSGIVSAQSFGIGSTEIIDRGMRLSGIASLDATTIATIEEAIRVGPNSFSDLKVSGISTFIGIATFLGGIDVNIRSGVSTFSSPVQFGFAQYDAAAGLSSNFVAVGATVGFGTSAFFRDNAAIFMGDASDFKLYHDNTNSYIDNMTGALYVRNSVDDDDNSSIIFQAKSGENSIVMTNSADESNEVELYYDGAKKLQTTSGGIQITGITTLTDRLHVQAGVSTFDADVRFGIGATVGFGTSAFFLDEASIFMGDSDDFELFHDGTDSVIRNRTGDLKLLINNTENGIVIKDNEGVEAYFDNSKKTETTSGGFKVTGITTLTNRLHVQAGVSTFDADVRFGIGATVGFGTSAFFKDEASIFMGDADDFELFHDGSDSVIRNRTGDLKLLINNTENGIIIKDNEGVEAYFDNSKKVETTSGGLKVTGITTLTDRLFVEAGISTFVGDVRFGIGATVGFGTSAFFRDDAAIFLGNDLDLKIHHDGSNSYVEDIGTGDLILKGSADIKLQSASGESYIVANDTGSVEVYYDNSKKLESTSGGLNITGITTFSDRINVVSGVSTFQDNAKLTFGTQADLTVYHNGTNSFITNKTGALMFNTADSVYFANLANDENYLVITDNGSVDIYYDNSKKLETTSGGLNITGITTFSDRINVVSGVSTFQDNAKLTFGGQGDLLIYHNATHSYITNATGDLNIQSGTTDPINLKTDDFRIYDQAGSDVILRAYADGGVVSYYDNQIVFQTTPQGVNVSGVTTTNRLLVSGISTFTGAIDANGNVDVAGNTVLNGNVDLGNATGDTITATGRFDSDIVPSTDNARDLGASGLEFKDLYIDGTANIDSLVADTAAIGDLTDNRVVIAGSAGELEGDGNFTFDGNQLKVGLGTIQVNGNAAFAGIVTIGGNLNVTGDIVYDEVSGRNLNISGITTLGSGNGGVSGLQVTGAGYVGGGATVGSNGPGIVTYYGDGGNLTGVTIGIGTTGDGSAGLHPVGYGATFLVFKGAGFTTAYYDGNLGIATLCFQGGGNAGAAGTWVPYGNLGIATSKSVGVGTVGMGVTSLQGGVKGASSGIGNSFSGLYIGNGMMVVDNALNGNHYIGTSYNGLMAGPVTINGVLTVDGNYVVV